VRPGLPKELDAIVLRALAREPDDRYETTRALGRELSASIVACGQVVDNAVLCDWMERLFPGGRAAHQRVIELATSSAANEPTRRAPRPTPPDESRAPRRSGAVRRVLVGLLASAVVASLLALALVVRPYRSVHPATSADSNRPLPEAPPPATPSIVGAPRQPVVLELGVTREGGEHHTLLRIRSEPQGDFRVEEAVDAGMTPAAK
jgi:serine/threonine-protein kinase